MFDSGGRDSLVSRIVPGLMLFAMFSMILGLLAQLGLLPRHVLLALFGPGFLIAAILVPDGAHSDAAVVFVLIGLCGTAAWWWLVLRFALAARVYLQTNLKARANQKPTPPPVD